MTRFLIRFAVCLPLLLAMQAATQPAKEHAAITGYRAYVNAIRAGDVAKTVAAVEPVPAECAPALTSAVKSLIAVEAIKNEMMKRFGPPKSEEEDGWNMGQISDAVVNLMRVGSEDTQTATLVVRDPGDPNGSDAKIAVMVRSGDAWRVPASQVLGEDFIAGTKFVMPSKDALDRAVTLADAITGAAGRVLVRLRAGEFKEAAAVQGAFEAEMAKAGG